MLKKNAMNKVIHAHNNGYRVDELGNLYNRQGKKMKPKKKGNRYLKFIIIIDGVHKDIYVHRLQAYQKFGEKVFKNGIVVRHLDGNMYNNSNENIAIGTVKENSLDRPKTLRIIQASNPKYSHSQILEDRNLGMSYRDIMNKHNISSKGTLSFIINKSLKTKSII